MPYAGPTSYIPEDWPYDNGFDSYYDHWHVDGTFIDNPAQLTNGQISRDSGTTSTMFVYTVKYNEPEGFIPTINRHVYIDGVRQEPGMTAPSTPSNGTYTYSTTLSVGNHNFYFKFDNEHGGTIRLPTTGAYDGPWVVDPPLVTNSTGESDVTSTSARLNGEVTNTGGENPTVHVYWGTTNGGTTPGNWQHDENLGAKGAGTFYKDIDSLSPNTTYCYRCYAVNSAGEDWANSTDYFTTPAPASPTISFDPTSLAFTATQGGSNPANQILNIYNSGTGTLAWSATDDANWLSLNPTSGSSTGQYNPVTVSANIAGMSSGTYNALITISAPGATNTPQSVPVSLTINLLPPPPPDEPTVTNSTGESNVTSISARLNGEVTSTGGENPTVHVCWGDNDGVTNPLDWDNDVNLGATAAGTFYTDISSLTPDTPYYYRCYASNSAGSDWADSTETFTTLAGGTQKLVGSDDAACQGNSVGNYFCLFRFQAVATGDMTTFKFKSSGSGNVKVAIYSDISGQPGNLLRAVNTSTPVSAGWNDIAIPSTPVLAGNYYWLAHNSDATIACRYTATGTPMRYRQATFSTFTFPDSPGSFTSNNSFTGLVAGWSSGSPPPVTAPTVTNSTGESNVTSTSARLNGDVTSTGGENPTVHVYWGDNDGGTDPLSWDNDVNLGIRGTGTFYTDVSGLTPSTNYFYRCFASNSAGSDWADSTESFTTSAAPPTTERLIGSSSAGNGDTLANRLILARFQAEQTGNITQIHLYSRASGNVKVAIYSDNAGQPDVRLGYNDSSTLVTAGQWNIVPILSTQVNTGTYYWLAAANDAAGAISYNTTSGSGTSKGKTITFSSFSFLDPLGTGFTDYTYDRAFAGWGTSGTAPLSITTTSLPDGTVGTAYSQTLAATGGNGSYIWDIISGSLPDGLTLTPANGLISGTPTTIGTYTFTARVTDGASNSDTQDLSIIVTSQLPSAPNNLVADAISSSQINLSWEDKSTNEAGFRIERKTGADNFIQIATIAANTTIYTDTGLSPTTNYCYRVTAYNSYGDSDYSNESCDNTATIVVLSADGEGTDTDGSYYGGDNNYTNINSDDDTSYWRGNESQCYRSWNWQDTALPPGSTINSVTMYTKGRSSTGWQRPQLYCRTPGLDLKDASGTIGPSYITVSYTWDTNPATGSAWTASQVNGAEFGIYVPSGNLYPQSYTYVYLVVDYFPGGPDPTSLVANTISPSRIDLRWADNSYNEEGFKIERKTGANDFDQIATVAANITTYSSTGLSANTQYCYRVRAYNSGGDSNYSNESCATTYPPLTITTNSLPDGTVFTPYSATLGATGGSGSYQWSIVSGSFPEGLWLNPSGDISGATYFTGTYIFTVRVEDGSDTATQPLSITVNPPPTPIIGYSPTNFSFDAIVDCPNPPDQILNIYNSGGGTLNWSVSDDANWLSLSPTSGSSSGETNTVTVSVNTNDLEEGTYHANITISSPEASPQVVPVTLIVYEE